MKIGILTLHRANNYGAALQCYALQETLLSLGHDVKIIDYRQPDTEMSYKAFSWRKIKQASGSLRALVKAFLYIIYSLIQQMGYNYFRNKYLYCTSLVHSAKEIPQQFDIYMIGSDQLWSIQCMGGNMDPIFFGQFPHPQNSKIMGYAISSNIISLKSIGVEKLNTFLDAFDCISLRESVICEWISTHTNFTVRQDIDPTMLYDIKRWDKLAGNKRPMKKRYILMYFLLPEQKSDAKKFAQKNGLTLVEVGKVAFSPTQFLSYVKHADYILGGSFHIAVFSVLLQKKFSIIKKNNDFDIRSAHLLKSLGLESRFINIQSLTDVDINASVDFTTAMKNIEVLKQDSMDYLLSIV